VSKAAYRVGWGVAIAVTAVVLFGFSRVCPDVPAATLRAKWATGASRFVAVDGMDVHYRDEGTGPAVVLLHGTSSSLHTWDGWAARLSTKYRVVRFDLPAFGLTGPSPDRDYHIDAYVRFVDDVVRRLDVPRFVLAGNSLGGRIAWHYAVLHPERVRGLVLVDASGYPNAATGRPLAFKLATLPVIPRIFARFDPRRLVEDGVRKAYGDPSRIRPGVLDRYRDLALFPGSRTAFLDRMREDVPDDVGPVSSISVPTLVLWGGLDRLVDPANAARFEHDIRGSRVIRYPDLGHVPMEEDPERTVTDVEPFLASLP
jgi:pimeloyl-ACP methyl ester carboxylesterase